jgi:hypothetical protein
VLAHAERRDEQWAEIAGAMNLFGGGCRLVLDGTSSRPAGPRELDWASFYGAFIWSTPV